MHNFIISIVNIYLFLFIVKGDIAQTKLENVEKYAADVLKMLMFDLEEEGFCSLLMNDFNLTINETMYGEEVMGNVRYFNGFVIGADDVYIKRGPIGQSLSEVTFEATVSATIVFKRLSYAYDMEAELSNGTQKATGIFKTGEVEYKIYMRKNLKSGVFTSSCEIMSAGSKRRIDFQPKNYYTTVIARKFNGVLYENFREFGNGLLGDLLQKIVAEKISFPVVNYDTKATYERPHHSHKDK